MSENSCEKKCRNWRLKWTARRTKWSKSPNTSQHWMRTSSDKRSRSPPTPSRSTSPHYPRENLTHCFWSLASDDQHGSRISLDVVRLSEGRPQSETPGLSEGGRETRQSQPRRMERENHGQFRETPRARHHGPPSSLDRLCPASVDPLQ